MERAAFDEIRQRAVAGNELAWSVLYDRYAPKMRGYAAAQGSADPDAVVGDVFFDLARNLARFTGDESAFRSWVFMIAHNRIIDERRRRSRAVEQPSMSSAADEQLAFWGAGDNEQEALDRLVTTEVVEILDRLSPEQRDVLLLRIVADVSVADTARILGKKESAVKAAQRRGLARLRERASVTAIWE